MDSPHTYRRRVGIRIWFTAAIVIFALLLLPALGNADDIMAAAPTDQDLTKLNIEDLLNIQVTTASRKSEKTAEAPASVTVITHDEIERYGYRTLAEALQSVVGLYVTTDRNYDYLGVRGYSVPGDYNTRILVLIDGVRMNDPVYDQAPIGEDLPVDIRSLERIEIVKGPGSALWGNNAMLAVVNLITKKGEDIHGGRVLQDVGTYDSLKSFAEFGDKLSNGVQFAGSASFEKSDGVPSIFFPAYNSPETNNGIARDVDGSSADRGYLAGSYGKFKILLDAGDSIKDIPTGSFGTVFNNPGNWTNDYNSVVSLNYETKCSTSRDDLLSVQLYDNRYSYRGNYIYDYGNPTLVTNVDSGSADWFGIDTRYTTSVTQRLSVTSGVEYRQASMQQENHDAAPYFQEYLAESETIDTESVYTQADLTVTSPLRLVAGLRLDHTSDIGSNVSPRAALIYSASASTTLKLLYGEAFRDPNYYESTYTSPGQSSDVALKPEKIATTEFVCERSFGSHTRLITSLFHYNLDHIINQTTDSAGNLLYVNESGVTSEGFETELESRVLNGIDGHIGFTVVRTRDQDTDERISNSPAILATAGISVPVAKRYFISPDAQLIGSRLTLAGNEIGPVLVCNLVMRTMEHKGLGLSLGIYDLFNETVLAPGTEGRKEDEVLQESRTFQFEASYSF